AEPVAVADRPPVQADKADVENRVTARPPVEHPEGPVSLGDDVEEPGHRDRHRLGRGDHCDTNHCRSQPRLTRDRQRLAGPPPSVSEPPPPPPRPRLRWRAPRDSEDPMAQEPARYRYGLVLRHDAPDALELTWLPATAAMTDEDWKTGLMLLAAEAEALSPPAILIDATRFDHQFSDRDGLMAWRDHHVTPRHNHAGVKKFAFVMPPGFPSSTAESGAQPSVDGPTAQFPTQWFLDRPTPLAWITRPRQRGVRLDSQA